MLIGICDDEQLIVNKLSRIVVKIFEKTGETVEILTFLSGKTLIECISDLDAVFLDIEMPKMDGYEVGKVIRKKDANCKIIMATGRVDKFKDSFKINAFRFITKPFDEIEIEEAIIALLKTRIGEESLLLFHNRAKVQMKQKNIKYIKAYNGYSEVIVGEDLYRSDLSLNELEEILDNRLFVRIHKQYIINMLYVERYDGDSIEINEKSIPISRRKKNDFRKEYTIFDINYRS